MLLFFTLWQRSRSCQSRLWHSHDRAVVIAAAALIVTVTSSEVRADTPDEAKIEIGARAFLASSPRIGTLGASAEGLYMPQQRYGFGAHVTAFRVDNGADPQYSDDGALDGGLHAVVFAEGDLLQGFITPYARLGLGLGSHSRYHAGSTQSGLEGVLVLEGGLALRVGPGVLRVAATPSLYGNDLLLPFGIGLGARF
jgi:hypothetical protein